MTLLFGLVFFLGGLLGPTFGFRQGSIKVNLQQSMSSRSSEACHQTRPILPLETPANSENEYDLFYLDNGMTVMLCSLPNSEKSSAALYLRAGAKDDPSHIPGLAHFTEHAVFLGSHTYPVENAFKTFLSKNGGSSNGGTAMEYTSYQFQVNSAKFSEALDIWSHFFVDPLFTDDAIGREVMAVDAEDSKNRILDNRRMLQVMKDVIVPEHPYKKFSTGNVQTLANGNAGANAAILAIQMHQFYAKHYNPHAMTLALVGPQPISELKQLAVKKFSAVQGKTPIPSLEDSSSTPGVSTHTPTSKSVVGSHGSNYDGVYPIDQAVIGHTIRVRPIKDLRDLSLLIPLPPTRQMHEAPPTRLLASLLSRKEQGSLFALLQDKGWATAVSGGERTDFSDFCLFEISVSLTVEGLSHYQEVIELIFSYLRLLEGASDAELMRIWDEIVVMGKIDFGFQEKATAYELAPFLANSMVELSLPLHRVLSNGWLLEPLDLNLLRREFLNRLIPTRSLIVLRSKTFSELPDDGPAAAAAALASQGCGELGVLRLEPWYKTPFAIKPEDPKVLERWSKARTGDAELTYPSGSMSLPPPNPYVSPELVFLVEPAKPHKLKSNPPQKLENFDSEHGNFQRNHAFYSLDEAFNQPRYVVHVLLHSCGHSSFARSGHPVLQLAAAVFQQAEARNLYAAGRAGLSYSFSVGSRGLGLSVAGYSPKLPLLLQKVAEKVGSTAYWESVDPATVEICKERQLRSLRSWTKERPDGVGDVMLAYLLNEDVRLPTERIALAEMSDKNLLVSVVKGALQRARLSVYVHGNRGDVHTARETISSLGALLGNDMPLAEVEAHQNDYGWGLKDRVLRARLIPMRKHHTEVLLDSFNPEDPNSALVLHLQTAMRSPATSALTIMLAQYLREPAFNELRTRRQLGYIVSTGAGGFGAQHHSMRGITVRVLSQRYGPQEMLTAVDEFLASQAETFAAITQDDLDSRAASVIRTLEDPPTAFSEEASSFWSAIVENQPFEWNELVIAELRALRVETLLRGWTEYIAPGSPTRRSIAIMLESNAHKQIRQSTSTSAAIEAMTLDQLTVLRDSLIFVNSPP